MKAMSEGDGKTIRQICAVRVALQRFAAEQTDPAVRFHLACLDFQLAKAPQHCDDREFRKKLADNVERISNSILAQSKSKQAAQFRGARSEQMTSLGQAYKATAGG